MFGGFRVRDRIIEKERKRWRESKSEGGAGEIRTVDPSIDWSEL
jgi:hypothetical protein